MIISEKIFCENGVAYIIRSAVENDAGKLSEVRLQIDGETENMDRERGEAFLDARDFEKIIKTDALERTNLFLVAVVNGRIAGFSRCQGSRLKRFSHKVEFGVCVLREYWGNKIGKNLLREFILWADSSGIKKITLDVLETNTRAIELYKSLGFEIEGILKYDRQLSDGRYYGTVKMSRFNGIQP